jgi:hypothetical protein
VSQSEVVIKEKEEKKAETEPEKKEEVVKLTSDEVLEILKRRAEKEAEPVRKLIEETLKGIEADLKNPRVSVWVTGVRDDGDVTMHIFPTENNIRKTFEKGGVFERLPELVKDTILKVTPKTEKTWFDLIRELKAKTEIKEEVKE